MNKQTKELAMKYAHKMGNSVLYNADYLEEFAELIVRECAVIAFHNVVNISGYADAEDVEQNIIDQMGVKG